MKIRFRWSVLAVVLLCVGLLAALAAPAAATHVAPEFVAGNPSCTGLGYASGFKVDPPNPGTYTIPGTSHTVTVSTDGVYFDWSSTLGMDAVISKGGPNANVYRYDPESFGDTGLHSPINPSNNQPFGLSHIEFCFDFELQVSKTASASYTTTYTWTIDKESSANYTGFIGDPPIVHPYSVAVDQTVVNSAIILTGTITIHNPAPTTATVSSVVDSASTAIGAVSFGAPCNATPFDIGPGGTVNCSYSVELGSTDPGNNHVDVFTSGSVGGGSADAGYTVTQNIVGFPTVNVTDTNGGLGSASGDFTWNYTRNFQCPSDPSAYTNGVFVMPAHVNTATIVETGQNDSATVNLTCYAPLVSKNAETDYTREFDWDIDKESSATYDLFIGEDVDHDYDITLTQTIDEYDFFVSGTITVENPHPSASMSVSLVDSVNGTSASLDCGGALIVPAGGSATCDYTADLGDGDKPADGTNTATVTFNGIDFVATAPYAFGDPTTIVGEPSVNVTDVNEQDGTQNFGPFGTSTLIEYTSNYACPTDTSLYVDGFFSFSVDNTSTINETGENDSETVTVNCYAPVVSKDAETTFTRTFNWTIEKDPDATYNGFTGDSFDHEYTVTVTKTGFTDSDWAVSGTITIVNPHPTDDMLLTSVVDEISDGLAAVVDCPSLTVPAGGSLVCTYSRSLPDGSDRTNTATASFNDIDFSGSADVIFGEPTTVVNDTINVDDSFAGDLGSFSDSGSVSYTRTFHCNEDEGTHVNTATIVETGQSDDATVTVNCYALEVTKNANPTFTRDWDWTIVKEGDQTELTLSTGQVFTVNYTVTVEATYADSDWAVSGDIWISNPAPIDATLTSVSDVVDSIAASVDCPSLVVPAEGSLHCTYSADLPDGEDRLNTATATLQNYHYDSEGNATPDGTTDFSGTANVDFGDPTTELDECVDVTDDHAGFLGTVCAEVGNQTFTFEYTLDVGPYPECGEFEFVNVASFETNDNGETGSDDHTIIVHVPCAGCTLTPGYWKTHSHHGPAPEDDAWFNLGDVDGDGILEGADELFFSSGLTYYQILWTPPSGGNAYLILAHAYIAAKLNIVNGAATTPEVDAAIAWAEAFFPGKTPSTTLSRTLRNAAIARATTLDNYNNGLIGPGHCDE